MPKVDCCGKELKDCKCGRSRTPGRREREAKDAAAPVKALTDLLQRLDGRAEMREKKTKEEMVKLIEKNDDKWQKRLEEDRKELMRIQDEKTDSKLRQSEEKTMEEFDKLRKEIIDFQKENVNVKVSEDASTVMFGGLQSLTFEQAQDSITRQVKKKLEEPEVIYFKGDDFIGLAFAKFATTRAAEDVVRKMSIAKLLVGENEVWCKKDLPLDKRVPLSFLLGTRRQLIDWGYSKQKVKVKDEDNALVIGGVTVLKAVVHDYQLKLDWASDYWKNWAELVDSQEFKKLLGRAEESLKKARDDKGKGDGKGKKGH